jgi:HSP20 family protein
MNTLIPLTRIFDAALNSSLDSEDSHSSTRGRAAFRMSPRADIIEGEREFQITMDLPGVKSDNLEIDLENQTLTVKASREDQVPEGFELRRRERPRSSAFERTFTLGNAVDADNISASLDSGVLMITLPKSEKSLPRRIEVK